MNRLFTETRSAVLAARAILWPMEGDIWFELVVEVMAEEMFEYPERYLLMEEMFSEGTLPGEAYVASQEEMQVIIRRAHDRYEQRYAAFLNLLLGKFLFLSFGSFLPVD